MNRWDEYYYEITQAVSSNSKCLSIKIGAIVVKDKSIIATGYNGPARGIPECGEARMEKDDRINILLEKESPKIIKSYCPRKLLGASSGELLQYCIAAHAEANCIANATRMGVNLSGGSMYMTCGIPCQNCLNLIINAGILTIVVANFNYYDMSSKYILDNSTLSVRTYGN